MPALEEIFSNEIQKTCVELFDTYGQPLSFSGMIDESPADLSGLAGVISFRGDQILGSFVVLTTDQVLQVTGPNYDHNDWVAELSNQFLGRFKRKVHSYGIDLMASTPVAVAGNQLQVTFSTEHVFQFDFDSPTKNTAVKIIVFIDAPLENKFEFENSDEKEEDNVAEGEMLLF